MRRGLGAASPPSREPRDRRRAPRPPRRLRQPAPPVPRLPVFAANRHVETIFAAFARSLPVVALRRECLRTPDDGAVAIDWVSGDDRALPREAPVLILLPGLTGGSDDTYVRHMLMRARSKGWRVVVFNSRGCADSPVTTAKFYSASFTGDLRQVVDHVLGRYPQSNVYAVGWSLGANILVRYLGEANANCLLIVTPQGGHLGWVAGQEAPFGCPWTDPIIMEFLEYIHNEKDTSCKDDESYEQQSVPLTSVHFSSQKVSIY